MSRPQRSPRPYADHLPHPVSLSGRHLAEGCKHLQWLSGDTLAFPGGRCRRRLGCRSGKGTNAPVRLSRRSSCPLAAPTPAPHRRPSPVDPRPSSRRTTARRRLRNRPLRARDRRRASARRQARRIRPSAAHARRAHGTRAPPRGHQTRSHPRRRTIAATPRLQLRRRLSRHRAPRDPRPGHRARSYGASSNLAAGSWSASSHPSSHTAPSELELRQQVSRTSGRSACLRSATSPSSPPSNAAGWGLTDRRGRVLIGPNSCSWYGMDDADN